MGKKKPFINRKSAVTFSVVSRCDDQEDDEAGVALVEGRLGPTPEAWRSSDRAAEPCHPLDLLGLGEQVENEPMKEERRREILEYGFPDDGYDYLKHMKTIGIGRGSTGLVSNSREAPESSTGESSRTRSVFIPAVRVSVPTADIKVVDARHLCVQDTDTDDVLGLEGSTIAGQDVRNIYEPSDIRDIEEAIRRLEGVEEVGAMEGEGDLLDDFVCTAAGDVIPLAYQGQEDPSDLGAGASTLSVSFEQVQLSRGGADVDISGLLDDYDDSELGDLEGHDIHGNMDIEVFKNRLREFEDAESLEGDEEDRSARGPRLDRKQLGKPHKVACLSEVDVEVVARTKAVLSAIDEGKVHEDEVEVRYVEDHHERWDCESVLSLRSSISHFPAKIGDLGGPKKTRSSTAGSTLTMKDHGGQFIELSSKTGLPKLPKVESEGEEGEGKDEGEVLGGHQLHPEALVRRKGEDSEEKKQRKALVKAAQREARLAKKQMKEVYKNESTKMKKQMATSRNTGSVFVMS